MAHALIENPILNSPFAEPARHFRFDDQDRITDQAVEGRRPSSYFVPIASPKKKPKELFDEVTPEKKTETDHVNRIRARVKLWRDRGYPGVTPATRTLLEHWTDPQRERKLFFCQVEALETLVFISEVARQTTYGDDWIEKHLRDAADRAGTPLFRLACKMATGSGKTVVMSMLIAWQTLNKRQSPRDNRFADAFLVVAPGITIRDRLRVLYPGDPENYYRKLDLVPPELLPELGTAKIVVTNFHAFKRREKGDAGALTKRVLTARNPGAFTESADEMVRRVCRELGTRREVVVLNDEAHHCYRPREDLANPRRGPGGEADPKEKLTAEEKKEAESQKKEARLWITGLEAVHAKVGAKAVYDLSATPFYLKGSGYPEGTLFPWVVSDFSLIDAIESGIVKVPRVPVADNAMTGEYPKYRNLWPHIRDGLPKKGRGTEEVTGLPVLPQELQGALESLYGHYKRQYAEWEADQEGRENGRTPPVFIVVCNNTSVSKLVFDYVAGHETAHAHPDGAPVVAPGHLDVFSNVRDQRWLARPNTILVDSEQLESDEGMSADFKRLAAHQIEEFKAEYRRRFPGRDAEGITDEDLMREVLNTVGKAGKLGEHIKCVVSVSMLTEGWDCLDEQTELLTPRGWIRRGQIRPGDEVYSLNRDTGRLEVVPVLEYGERPVRPGERMARLKSQHLDIRVTEGHQFHVKYRDPRAGGRLARTFLTLTGRDLATRRSAYALPLSAEAAEPFPGVPLTDDALRFVAWFMTDGGFCGHNVVISQSKPYRDEIRGLLTRLRLDFTETVIPPGPGAYPSSRPCRRFRVPKGTHTGTLARRGWWPYREYLDKDVAPALHRMTREQFRLFWEELLKGDGERQGARAGWLWCHSKAQADAYTFLAVVRGFAASCHPEVTSAGRPVYRVTVRDTGWITSDPADARATRVTLEAPEPGEMVWCVRNRNSTLVTRREGKIVILGNCHTVTHVLGVRAFGTQLLCEQVIGRALRRESYSLNDKGHFDPEYAEVYGVPFAFIPCAGVPTEGEEKRPVPKPGRVRAVPERLAGRPWLEVTFPRVLGYRYEVPAERLAAKFDPSSRLVLSTTDIPTRTEMAPIVGESVVMTLDDLMGVRPQAVAFKLATHLQRHHFRDKVWLFPQLLGIVREWLGDPDGDSPYVDYGDETFPGLLLFVQKANEAAEKVYKAIVAGSGGPKRLRAELPEFDRTGSTAGVSYDTVKTLWKTDPAKCHLNYVPEDSGWETQFVEKIERMDEVRAYVKNQNLGFKVPYTCEGRPGNYYPDYILKIDDGRGPGDLLHLVLEVTGEKKKEKEAKVETVKTLWVPAVNNEGVFGRWAFVEIDASNRNKAMQTIRRFVTDNNDGR